MAQLATPKAIPQKPQIQIANNANNRQCGTLFINTHQTVQSKDGQGKDSITKLR